jgi:integration host factor subunit beta
MMTTRYDLINKVAEKMPDLLKADVAASVAIAFDHIALSLASGNRVEVRGFGSFNIGERTLAPTTNLNQALPDHMHIKTVNYRMSQALNDLINK